MLEKIWGWWKSAVEWCHIEFRESAENLMRDLRSVRSLFNYLYLLLYMFLCVWTALYHPEALKTAIVTTGGIVSAIFTAYVWGTTKEKEMGARKIHTKKLHRTNEPEEASD